MPISGLATYYDLRGNITASGEIFDPNAMTAAMTPDRAPLGSRVRVQLVADSTKLIEVRINDIGPFARDQNGKVFSELKPDPDIVIDLTPAAFRQLCGDLRVGRVRVNVVVET